MQPGQEALPLPAHVDAILSADVASTLLGLARVNPTLKLSLDPGAARLTDLRYQAHLTTRVQTQYLNQV